MRTLCDWERRAALSKLLDVKSRSLVRANLLVFAGMSVAFLSWRFSSPPRMYLSSLATIVSAAGAVDTARNLETRWSYRHAGIMLMLGADLMILAFLALVSVFEMLPSH